MYTIDNLLGSPQIVGAIVDRVMAEQSNQIDWNKYLKFEKTNDKIFRSLYGATSRVRMGSFVDRNSTKPLRSREGFGEAILEVIPMGDRMQMDNDRLENLRSIVDRLNAQGINSPALKEFTDYVANDILELSLAPHKRMDKVLGDLRSTGTASAELGSAKFLDMEIPINKETASGSKAELMPWLFNLISNDYSHLNFGVLEMNPKTFNKYFATNTAFVKNVRTSLGASAIDSSGFLTVELVSAFMQSVGLPQIRIVRGVVEDLDRNASPIFADDKISFLPEGELGVMRWREPYESNDPIPAKTYTKRDGGLFISTQRTDEGRFVEYGCEWVPEIRAVKNILNIDLASLS